MLAADGYKTKKNLKDSIGKNLSYIETSAFGPEYKSDGKISVVGPSAYDRKWYANVYLTNGLITKVE